MIRRSAQEKRRSPIGIVVSVALHVVFFAVVAQITLGDYALEIFFDRERPSMPAERLEYIELAGTSSDATERREGGNGRPVTAEPQVAPPPLVAPSEQPTSLPPVDTERAPVTAEPEGRGPLVGGGGPLRGIQPAFRDARIWAPLGALPVEPRTVHDLVDSTIVATVERHLDSLAALPVEREAGDWTFERDGKKWGIDRQYIRLGDVSLPTALLALLPLNVQGNPNEIERERALSQQRRDIQFQANRAAVRDELKSARERIRERVEAERAERQRANQRGPVRPPPDDR